MSGISISNTVSRDSIYENMSMFRASLEDAAGRRTGETGPEAISNEEIRKDDRLLETYRVESDAIHGGMGSVWRVHHLGWDTDLAMKRPQPRFFAEGSEQRKADFIAECENWINLGLHPNIVSCYYVSDLGGVPSIFSEWMDSGSLKDAIRNRRLYENIPEDEVQVRILDLAIQTARGLKYSHENGLIHQDVKPGNILLTQEWEAKAADFGLAKAESRLTEKGRPASTGYTPEYCPKEQADGGEAEPWMDVYAWALTVLEMYAEERLWRTGAEAREHCREYFPQCRHRLPPAVAELIAECVSGKLRDFAGITGLLTGEYSRMTGQDYPRTEPEAAGDTADSLNNRALSFLDLNNPQTAEKCWAFALSRDAAHLPSLYNQGLFLWRRALIDDEELVRRMSDADRKDTAFSGRWLRELDAERGVESEAVYGQKHRTLSGIGDSANMAFSPDGKKIVTVSNKELQGWNAETGECLYTRIYGKKQPASYRIAAGISPDGRYAVFSERNEASPLFGTTPFGNFTKMLYIADAASGEILHTVQAHMTSVLSLCFHPDGKHAYTSASDSCIRKWDLETGKCVREYRTGQTVVPAVTVSTDGKRLYAADGGFRDEPRNIFRIDAESGETTRILSTEKKITSLCVSPDEKRIFFCGDRTLVRTEPGSGETLEILLQREAKLTGLSADGSRLSLSDGQTVKILDTETLRCLTTFNVPEVCSTSADASLQNFAVSSLIVQAGTGCCGIYSLKETKPAPWEICVIRTYRETTDARKEWEALCSRAEEAVRRGDARNAAALTGQLRDRIGDGSQAELLRMTRKLARICRKKEIAGISEIRPGQIPDDMRPEKRETDPPGEKRAYSADGKLLFTGKENGDMILRETATGAERFRIPSGVPVYAAALSPDCRTAVAANRDGQLVIIDIVNRRLARKDLPHRGTAAFLFFSPDGRKLYSLTREYSLDVWETGNWWVETSLSPVRSLTGEGILSAALAREGRWLAYSERKGDSLRILDLQDGRKGASIHVSGPAKEVSFDPQAVLLFASDGQRENAYELIWKWDV